ncbi:hypothetical protein [Pseudoalteromonas sp. R3]|uniref:hypothetical protein n=1 Tax=Pseudoalteromonas sp. R3 TaxID=1709477 RepID=UPI0006B54D68|nr:hypothetical protein [Pseudoalteromonas sp. R3]AZZ98101.1 hypothetical protein ELR70_13865 [Pseudoalteromonas sp. R3]
MEDLKAEVSSLRTEVKYLKIIIPSACGFVALLLLIFWGVERNNIGERVSEALNEHAVSQALQDIEQSKLSAEQHLSDIEQLHQSSKNKAQSLINEIKSIKQESPWSVVEILSVDHSSGTKGQYFNFDVHVIDDALGHPNWHDKVFLILDTNTQKLDRAILWRSKNGGSIGDGHGRWNSGASPNQWSAGKSLVILSGPQA